MQSDSLEPVAPAVPMPSIQEPVPSIVDVAPSCSPAHDYYYPDYSYPDWHDSHYYYPDYIYPYRSYDLGFHDYWVGTGVSVNLYPSYGFYGHRRHFGHRHRYRLHRRGYRW